MNITSQRTLDKYTIGWICALPVEYYTARTFLDETHTVPTSFRDNTHYSFGKIGPHNIVIATFLDNEDGLPSTASVIKSVLGNFPNIRISLLVGIGGGAPSRKHDIRLGDVVVGISSKDEGGVVQYDFEKTMQSQEFHETGSNQAPELLRTAVTALQARYSLSHTRKDRAVDFALRRQSILRPKASSDRLYPSSVIHPAEGGAECSTICGNDPSSLVERHDRDKNDGPEIHYGLIASANTQMKDASVRDKLIEKRDILCFETGVAGLMNDFPCLVIRGICDYSDSHGNKEWQIYAAMTAAAYAETILHQIGLWQVERLPRIRITSAIPKVQEEGSKPNGPSDSLQSGLHGLSEPLQKAFAPYLENEGFREQVKDQIEHLQSNAKLREEAALDFLHSLGSVTEVDALIKGTTYSNTLMAGLQELPEPLQKYVMPYLENKTALENVEKRLAELQSNTKLRQNSALELLDALGLAEETENRDQDSSKKVDEQESLREDETLPTSEDNTPSDPEEEASQQSIPTTTTARPSQPGNNCPNFFDWATFRIYQLDAIEDIMEKSHITTLALYDSVKVDVSVQGNSITLEGLARLIRHWFHKKDVLAYFRSGDREIWLPVDYVEEENHKQQLKDLDTWLFDTQKFNGFGTQLTSVTYGSSKYGTITLFELIDPIKGIPTKIRPLAAMKRVPKIIMEKMGRGLDGSTKTTLTMPNHQIWDATEQKGVGRHSSPILKPNLSSCSSDVSLSIGDGLRMALSMDYEDAPLSKFAATIPQMVAMLHHKTDIIQHIKSTPVHVEEKGKQPWVQMEVGPRTRGHENTNLRIIVLAPARGKWVEKRFWWK